MKGTAARYLMLAVICCAVLSLLLGNPSAVGAQPSGCPQCHGAAQGMAHCPCCPADIPGQCGASGHGGMLTCHCSSGNLALLAPLATGTPNWQVFPYVLVMVTISSKLFTANIFHPPELRHFSTQV